MFALLGTLVTSILSGGATGLLGLVIQRWFDFRNRAQDLELVRINHEQARALAKIESERVARAAQAQETIAQAQADAQVGAAELEAQARADEAAARGYIASLEADRARYLDAEAQRSSRLARWAMAVVDFTRGMVRPVLTAYLVVVAHLMFYWAQQLAAQHGQQLSADQVHQLVLQIVGTLLYLATTAVVWWFGSRPPARPSK
jgi:uncharacterized membrane protein